jgi:hypothetical protein
MKVTDSLRINDSTLLELLTSLLLASLWLACSSAVTFAQTTSGGVRGVVLDANGSAIPGASVTAKNVATGVELKTTSTADGLYVIPRILPGVYQLSAEAASFKKASFTDVEVTVGKDTVLDFKLEPGAITEVVTVAGGAEGAEGVAGAACWRLANQRHSARAERAALHAGAAFDLAQSL